jgi:hypothetical protein
MAQDPLAQEETHSCIAADKVAGTAVYNAEGEKLGAIDTVMINKRSGRVVYAVMSFGGFLGIGARQHPMPWSVLRYDTKRGGYVVLLTREQLERAPTTAVGETPNYGDPRWGRKVYDYYGVPFF